MKLKEIGISSNYKFIVDEIFNNFKYIKLNNEIQCAYLCRILEKVNNFANMTINMFTKELSPRYFDQMKGYAFSLFNKCLHIFELEQNINNNYHNHLIMKYKTLLINKHMTLMNYNNITNVLKYIYEFISRIHIKDIQYLYSNDSISNKFISIYNTLKERVDNVKEYLTLCELRDNGVYGDNAYVNYNIAFMCNIIINDMKSILQNELCVVYYLYRNTIDVIESIRNKYNEFHIESYSKYEYIEYMKLIEKDVFAYENDNLNMVNETAYDVINNLDTYYLNLNDSSNDDNNNTNNDNESALYNLNKLIENIEVFTTFNNESLPLHVISFSVLPKVNDILLSLFKLANISITIFYNISLNGFCTPEQVKADNSKSEGNAVHEGGYGMAEGEGMEDITKQIEDEEQLLGLKEENENKEDDGNYNNGKNEENGDKKESGFEMKTDFKEDFKEEIGGDEDKENSDIEREED
jgi:midasin